MASQTPNSLNIHDVEGPVVLFIKKKLSTYNYQNICMQGGRTHNFIIYTCVRGETFGEELSEEES